MVIAGECKLVYSADFSETHPILIEATDELLKEIRGGQIHVTFCPKGVAYLSSRDNTYQVRRADNSNTLLFASRRTETEASIDCGSDGIVVADKLWSSEIPDAEVSSIFNQKPADIFQKLMYSTIWSERQILSHLRTSDNYFLYEGNWHFIPDEQFYCDLDALLNLCAITSGGKEFNTEELWIQMNEFNESENRIGVTLTYVQFLLSRLSIGESFENKGESDWPLVLALNEDKIIIHRGKQVLHQKLSERCRQLDLAILLTEWKALLETSVGVDAFLIDENVLVEKFLQQVISGRASLENGFLTWLDSRTLSIHIEERLQQLFKIKARWMKNEFESYIIPLLPPNTKPEAILLKSCRLDEESDGNWYYSSKF